jgi:nucleoside-diphosphate-sugar epimerase
MKALITGGTGLIGLSTARELSTSGAEVTLLDLEPDQEAVDALAPDAEVRRCDVGDANAVGREIAQGPVDVVVHLAGRLGLQMSADPVGATQLNCMATANILAAAKAAGVGRVVLASSIAVYDGFRLSAGDGPVGEDAMLRPREPVALYGASKIYAEALAEVYATHHGLSTAGLRPSLVFGAHRRRGAALWSEQIINYPALGRAGTVEGVGRESRFSYIYVDDIASQLTILCAANESDLAERRFFNSGGDPVSVGDMVDEVCRQIPDASISIPQNGPDRIAGGVTNPSDAAFRERFGFERRFDLGKGIAAQIAAVRAAARPG